MNIGSIPANPLLSLISSASSGSNGVSGFLPTQNNSAKSAVNATILPSATPVQMSAETLLMLQGDHSGDDTASATAASLQQPSVEDQFLAEARKSPMERIREQVLKALGVSEQQLAQMPADQRRAMEDRIKDLIQEKVREAHNAGNGLPDSNTEMLQSQA